METKVKDISVYRIQSNAEDIFKANDKYDAVDKFARNALYKVWENEPKQEGTWRGYKNFEMLSETQMRINFEYGAGDMEYDGSYFLYFHDDGHYTISDEKLKIINE